MKILGCANHTPEQLLHWLEKHNIATPADIAIVQQGTHLSSKRPKSRFLFVTDIESVRVNQHVLNSQSYANTFMFMFGSSLTLSRVSNIVPLDYSKSTSLPLTFDQEKLSPSSIRRSLKSTHLHVGIHNHDNLKELTDRVKLGSLLNPLMTFIYTLPRATHQTQVKEVVAYYIYYGSSVQKFRKLLEDQDIVLSDRVFSRLFEILNSDVGKNYRAAFETYRKQGLAIACKKHKVSSYEMSYIASVVESKK